MTAWQQWKSVSISIDVAPEEVYDYMVNPANFSEWAISCCDAVRPDGDGWRIETAAGEMGLRFAERNEYGIMDHYVQQADGPEILFPARVVPGVGGSRVIFTVFRTPEWLDSRYAGEWRDAELDLQMLKSVLERRVSAEK